MSLIKTGGGITDIRGGFGGIYFHRDKSGLHSSSKPRTVHRRSAAQNKQRNAFTKARRFTRDPRWVSYYIYRALNNLPFIFDAIVTGDPNPDCTGKYVLAGTYNDEDYYEKDNSAFFIWYHPPSDWWVITTILGDWAVGYWWTTKGLESWYKFAEGFSGIPTVTLELTPPPSGYEPSNL